MTGMINAGYTFGFDNGNAIIAGINDGILRGAVSVGINYATQEANLDPLLGLMLMCQCIGVSVNCNYKCNKEPNRGIER